MSNPSTPTPTPTPSSELWEQRFRAPRVTLPDWAWLAPERTVAVSNASGTWEIYAWSPGGRLRQVTDRPKGTLLGTVSPDGERIWWFDDTDGDEFGVWRTEPWDASAPPRPAHPELAAGYPAGLALARDGRAYVGRSDAAGSEVWRLDPDGSPPVLLYASSEDASVEAVSPDGSLVVIAHSEHGDNRHPALRLVDNTGQRVADLWDGPGKGLHALGFAPDRADLLVAHERRGRSELLIWDGEQVRELALDVPGELSASWYPDGRALLVTADHLARTGLYRVELDTGACERLDAGEGGTVAAATARPDGAVWLQHSSGLLPPAVRDLDGRVILTAEGASAPPGVAFEDVFVDIPDGRLHVLVARPAGPPPYPLVVDVHGGPAAHDEDGYDPHAAAFVDAGYAVAQVNYRGSTGYGSAWRDANEADPGFVELADIAAARAALVERGLADPARTAISGASWGGYLTLLALGTQPDAWVAGVAIVPVADYVAAYEDEMEPLQAFDRALFGGSPPDVPDRYRRASPLTYVADVRAPVLVIAGVNDPRCPIRQIENYLAALTDRGARCEVYRYDAGHGALVVEERIAQMRRELDFLARHVPVDPLNV